MSTQLESDVELILGHTIGVTGDRSHRALTQGASVRLKFKVPQSYVDASRYVTNIQDFVSIATNRVAQIDHFRFFAPDLTIVDPNGGAPHRIPADLYVEWIARERSDKALMEAPVPFDAIGGIDGVKTWLDTTGPFQPHITRVMATRYHPTMYADDRFFSCAAALDGLHRHWVPAKTHYVDRLKALAVRAGDTFVHLVHNVDKWAAKVVTERNDHAHHLGNAAQTTGATRYFLARSAYWLFVLALLKECQFPQKVFDTIEENAEFNWIKRNLIRVL